MRWHTGAAELGSRCLLVEVHCLTAHRGDAAAERVRCARAQGALAAPQGRRYDHPGMLQLQAAAQHGWGSSPPGQPSMLGGLGGGPARGGAGLPAWALGAPPAQARHARALPPGEGLGATLAGEQLGLLGGRLRSGSVGGAAGAGSRAAGAASGISEVGPMGGWAAGLPGGQLPGGSGGNPGGRGWEASQRSDGSGLGPPPAEQAMLLPSAWMLSPERPSEVVTWPGLPPSPPVIPPAPDGGGDGAPDARAGSLDAGAQAGSATDGDGGGGGDGGGRGEAAAGAADDMRMSLKLLDAEPAELQPGIRRELEATMGGPAQVVSLQAAVRPGCVHVVADALLATVRSRRRRKKMLTVNYD
jgi:hypothetical protein